MFDRYLGFDGPQGCVLNYQREYLYEIKNGKWVKIHDHLVAYYFASNLWSSISNLLVTMDRN